MDYEYESTEESYGGRVLWGRVAVLGAALLLMFALGRCTAGEAADPEELAERERQIEALSAEVADLERELAALSAAEPTPEEPPPAPDQPADGASYEVQSGDTLNSIAERLCGSTEFAPQIAEMNGIDAVNRLQVGQVLELPPECTS
jgi:nucleoid-associated protein YgaU